MSLRGEMWLRLAALCAGAALVALGLSGLGSAVLRVPAVAALEAVREGRPVSSDELERAGAALPRRAGGTGAAARALSELALVELLRSRADDASASEAERLLGSSMAAQVAALARAPADTDGWARLAYARYALSGLDAGTGDALAMSFRTGRLERAPMAFRIQLAMREWSALDPELRALGQLQVRRLADSHLRDLDALVEVHLTSDPAVQDGIRAALAHEPRLLDDFERRVRWTERRL